MRAMATTLLQVVGMSYCHPEGLGEFFDGDQDGDDDVLFNPFGDEDFAQQRKSKTSAASAAAAPSGGRCALFSSGGAAASSSAAAAGANSARAAVGAFEGKHASSMLFSRHSVPAADDGYHHTAGE